MQCGQCGQQVPEGALFCGQCGARVVPAVSEPPMPPAAPAPRAAAPTRATASAPQTPEALVGKTIAGRYRLIRLVGEGGMGSVYEAEQTLGSSQRAVAVKLLRPEWSHDPAVKARFHREAATVARLEHFNTVRVYDFGATDDGTLYIVMEFLHGRSLQKVLDEQGALSPERVARLATQMAASLEEAHGLGIVHRDLKPDNILLLDNYASQHDVVKIVDFGIAKGQPALGHGTTRLTELGSFVGTPAYMSPEQFSAGGVSARSDIYSLGVTTYQMLTGKLPFEADTALEWAQAHTSRAPAPLATRPGGAPIPEGVRRAVLRALSKDPAERQASAAEFARELSGDATAETEPVRAEAPRNTAPRAAASGMNTAPMAEVPDLSAARASVPTTQPMAVVEAAWPAARAQAYSAPPPPPAPRRSNGLIWTMVAALGLLGGAMVVVALDLPQRLLAGSEPALPPALPSRVDIPPEAQLPPAPAEPAPPRSPEPAAPERPAPPRPSPPPKPAPSPPKPAPANPPVASGGAGGAPAAPVPVPAQGGASSPPVPVPVPGLPTPPWNLPSPAGACDRCLKALSAGGHYAIPTAAGESLLCEDANARLTCERQIAESAPAAAEQAAREGDCAAALAIVAAGVKVGLSPDTFGAAKAQCGLR